MNDPAPSDVTTVMNLRHPTLRPRLARWLALLTVALVGCAALFATTANSQESTPHDTGDVDPTPGPTTVPDPTPPTTGPSDTTTTTPTPAPPPTTAVAAPEPAVLRLGDRGPEVLALQQRLVDLGVWLPAVDGVYGEVTEQAVLAFQKHVGLGRDGVAGPATLAALDTAPPVSAVDSGDHIEIDLDRQLLIVVSGDQVLAFNTSTGAPGWETPRGRFTIDREIDGLRSAPLGELWRPKYFNRGIAIHGSPSIPGHAASHGCARLHDAAIDFVWAEGLAPVGTPVLVH